MQSSVAEMFVCTSIFKYFYRTHVHMGSDHWVDLSLSMYVSMCLVEDLVKTVNVDPS